MDEIVIEHPHDGVAVLRIARPERRNALSNATVAALVDALDGCAEDGTTRAVVLAGDARAFAAGADIGELLDPGPDLERWDRVWSSPLPLIAAVRGMALGGGLELALSCDLIVVADDARLGQPEIRLGLMPGAGGTQRLARTVGKALAMEIVLLGRELDGREAVARGLATRAVPTERVEAVALEWAVALAALAPAAVREAKRAVLSAFDLPLADGVRAERAAFRRLLAGDDACEGIAAFLEKRAPRWTR